jgi:predicted transcriptional regulator
MPAVTRSGLPTASELEILHVIWKRGPSTVRDVYRVLGAERDMGYSTVLKFMQIMATKGTLVRDGSVRPQVYRSAHPQAQMQRGIMRDLVQRVFGGSAIDLVVHALSDRRATPHERQRIRELLDELDGSSGEPAAVKGSRGRK